MEAWDSFDHVLAPSHALDVLETELTMSQCKILYLVIAVGGIRMSELAARLGLALSTVSGAVDRMVDLGYVDRHDDPADRRQVVVAVTAAGEEQLDRMRELNSRQLRLLLDQIADDDLEILARALVVMIEAAIRAGASTATSAHASGVRHGATSTSDSGMPALSDQDTISPPPGGHAS